MRKNEMQTQQALDRIQGCMVGGAVGDALGYAVEFISWPQIQRRYGPDGIREMVLDARGMACISDDTQMSLFTAGGVLLGMTRGYLRGIMGRLDDYCRVSYIDWLHTQEYSSKEAAGKGHTWLTDVPGLYDQRAPGNTCLSALRALEKGREVKNDSCGCGGVMRTAPIALVCYLHDYAGGSLPRVDLAAAETARITHKHPLGFLPSAVLNHVLWQIMAGKVDSREDLQRAFLEAAREIRQVVAQEYGGKTWGELWPEYCSELESILDTALRYAGNDMPDVETIELIGGGWTGHEALAIAAYSAVRHYGSFEESVISAVNHSGDSDSTGAVCGQIAGCLYGRGAIPARFTERLELLDIIEEISHDLWTGCIVSEYDPADTPEQVRWIQKYAH
jgi:ADP-ribosylglycohydrolase